MKNKEAIKKMGIGAVIVAVFVGAFYILKKRGIFSSHYRVEGERPMMQYFSNLNKSGMSNFKRDISENYVVNL